MAKDYKFQNVDVDNFFKAILSLESMEECYMFFDDICTIKEINSMAQRLHVAQLLRDKKTYNEVEGTTNASTATISRINRCLMYGSGGYNMVLDRIGEEETQEDA